MSNPLRGASRGLLLVIVILVVGLVAACASAGSAASPAPENVGRPAASPGSGVGSGQGAGAVGGEQPRPDGFAPRDDAQIIRTGSVQVEVDDVRTALSRARDLITGMDGYIGASQQFTYEGSVTATVSYRVPGDRWEDALDGIRALGEAVAEQTNAVEVTDQIVDLEARIRNLKASETALVRHAANAERITDLLEIESRLTDIRGQIEQLTAQQANLEDRAAFATLDVTYGTEVAAIEVASREWDPKAEVDRAGASLVGFLQALTTAGIWFAIVWLPILLVFGLLVVAGYAIARRLGFVRRNRPPLVPPTAPAEG